MHYQERRCARQQLDETVTELCMGRDEMGRLVQMVAFELKLTKKDTADRDGAGPSLPRIVVERIPEVGPRRFYVLSADIEAHGRTGGSPGCAPLASHGRAIKPHNNECRERIRTRIERTLTGKARMSAYKDRIAETERVKERKRAREDKGAGDASSTHVSLEYLASGEKQDRPEPVLVQKSGHVDDDMRISVLDVFHEMDGRESRKRCRIGIEMKMPEILLEVT